MIEQKHTDFYNDYKSIIEYDEIGNEYSNTDILSEMGDLINKYNLEREDLRIILDEFDMSFDDSDFLIHEYNHWNDFDNDEISEVNKLLEVISKYVPINIQKDSLERLKKEIINKFDIDIN